MWFFLDLSPSIKMIFYTFKKSDSMPSLVPIVMGFNLSLLVVDFLKGWYMYARFEAF